MSKSMLMTSWENPMRSSPPPPLDKDAAIGPLAAAKDEEADGGAAVEAVDTLVPASTST